MSSKIHKQNNPGKPVRNSINCHTADILRFVDYHLQPITKKISSYISRTNNFINKINNFPFPQLQLQLQFHSYNGH